MITIKVFKSGNYVKGFEISGHSGYGKKGRDIICAGVSALTYTLINSLEALLQIKANCQISDEGYAKYLLPQSIESKKSDDAQLLISAIIIGFKNMRDSYKSFIEVFEEEV